MLVRLDGVVQVDELYVLLALDVLAHYWYRNRIVI